MLTPVPRSCLVLKTIVAPDRNLHKRHSFESMILNRVLSYFKWRTRCNWNFVFEFSAVKIALKSLFPIFFIPSYIRISCSFLNYYFLLFLEKAELELTSSPLCLVFILCKKGTSTNRIRKIGISISSRFIKTQKRTRPISIHPSSLRPHARSITLCTARFTG